MRKAPELFRVEPEVFRIGVDKVTEHRKKCSGASRNVPGGSGRFPRPYGSIWRARELSWTRKSSLGQVGKSKRLQVGGKQVSEQSGLRLICPANTTYCISCPPITETIPVDRKLSQYHFHMNQSYLEQFQSILAIFFALYLLPLNLQSFQYSNRLLHKCVTQQVRYYVDMTRNVFQTQSFFNNQQRSHGHPC